MIRRSCSRRINCCVPSMTIITPCSMVTLCRPLLRHRFQKDGGFLLIAIPPRPLPSFHRQRVLRFCSRFIPRNDLGERERFDSDRSSSLVIDVWHRMTQLWREGCIFMRLRHPVDVTRYIYTEMYIIVQQKWGILKGCFLVDRWHNRKTLLLFFLFGLKFIFVEMVFNNECVSNLICFVLR